MPNDINLEPVPSEEALPFPAEQPGITGSLTSINIGHADFSSLGYVPVMPPKTIRMKEKERKKKPIEGLSFIFNDAEYSVNDGVEDAYFKGKLVPIKDTYKIISEIDVVITDVGFTVVPTKHVYSIVELSNREFSITIAAVVQEGVVRDTMQIFNTVEYLNSKGFVENYTNGIFYYKDFMPIIEKYPTRSHLQISKFYYSDHKKSFWNSLRIMLRKNEHVILTELNNKKYNKVTPKTFRSTGGMEYTFGVEIECKRSDIRKTLLAELEISVERDGSLNSGEGGPEYITEVLQGDVGVNHLQKIMRELGLRSTIDNYCSIHLHLGNINFNTEVICNMYMICKKIEESLFNMMPKSRRNNVYCKKLPKIKLKTLKEDCSYQYSNDIFYNEFYTELFIIACGKEPSKEVNSKTQHPNGPKCGYDKDNIRYSWVNFIHALFKTRQSIENKTIEFRLHSATLSFEKVYMWLLICMAIVKYSENVFIKETDDVTIEKIIKYAFPNKYESLLNYINSRTELFATNADAEKKEYYKLSNKKIIKKTLKELCA